MWGLYELREEGYIFPADLKALVAKLRSICTYRTPNYSLTSMVPELTVWSPDERFKI
jgi:hypothetical protein